MWRRLSIDWAYLIKQLHIELGTWSIINHLAHLHFSIYMCKFTSLKGMFPNPNQILLSLLHSYFFSPALTWSSKCKCSPNFFSTNDLCLLTGCLVCRWCLCKGDEIRILLTHFLESTWLIMFLYITFGIDNNGVGRGRFDCNVSGDIVCRLPYVVAKVRATSLTVDYNVITSWEIIYFESAYFVI